MPNQFTRWIDSQCDRIVANRWFAWTLWPFAGGIAWVMFFLLNLGFTASFKHLDEPRAQSVGDWLRLTRIGYGASRPGDLRLSFAPAKAELMRDVAVLRGPYTRLMVKSKGPGGKDVIRPRLDSRTLDACRTLIEVECNPGAGIKQPLLLNDGEPAAVFAHLRLQLDLLRLRHTYLSPYVLSKIGTLSPNTEDLQRLNLQRSRSETATIIRKLEEGFWGTDPLSLPAGILATVVEDYRNKLQECCSELKTKWNVALPNPGVVWNSPAEQQSFLDDVNRLVLFEANPHLAILPSGNPDRHPGGLTIFYFPASRSAANNRDARENNEPPASGQSISTDSQDLSYLYAMQVSGEGGWGSGQQWSAHFVLLDTKRPGYPIIDPRQPATDIVTRGPGWKGFRPAAVKVSEEQLAARFFPQLDELQIGAGIKTPLKPKTDEEIARYVAFLQGLLVRTLGLSQAFSHVAPQSADAITDPQWLDSDRRAGAGPTAQFSPVPQLLERWIVWPRRWNGGTEWGAIQFTVVFLTVRYILEFITVVRIIGAIWSPPPRGGGTDILPEDLRSAVTETRVVLTEGAPPSEQLARVVRIASNRAHTLRAITAALPLVGFFGTVAGLSNALVGASGVSSESALQRQAALQSMEIALGTAFDKSMLAFAAAIFCMSFDRWMAWRINRLQNSLFTLDPKMLAVYLNRGNAYHAKGDLDRAMSDYDEAIRINPKYTAALSNRGSLWMAKGKYDRALADFDKTIRLDPTDFLAHSGRGLALFKKGEFAKALAYCDEVVLLHPMCAGAYRNRATLRATCPDQLFRDGRQAVKDAKMALKLRCWSVDILAAAYAEVGDFKTAVRLQKVAIKSAPEGEKNDWQDRLQLYQANLPFLAVVGKK